MTTHDDLETRLRASLRERADDVDTTPALYERVQRQATRGTWLRRGLALAGAAAVVAGTFVVVPSLLPEPDPGLDIADTPQDAAPTPTQAPGEEGDPEPAVPGEDGAVDAFVEQGLTYAQDDGEGGSLVHVFGRVVRSRVPVVSLDAYAEPGDAPWEYVVAGRADGTIGIVSRASVQSGSAAELDDQFDAVLPAAANGGRAVVAPLGEAIAWIEGSSLHVLPLTADITAGAGGEISLADARVLPLEGDVPPDLQIEQWFRAADAPVVLATAPGGDVWSIPMEESNAFNSAPTGPGFVLEAGGLDAALLPDLRTLVVTSTSDGRVGLFVGGEQVDLPVELSDAADLELAVGLGGRTTLHDPANGRGVVTAPVEDGQLMTDFSWQDPGVTAVAPLTAPMTASDAVASGDGAADLGLPTDAPVVGTAGTDLLVRSAGGETQTIAVYPAESEATLGRLAVRPGSTLDDGLVAVESFSEGETSIRFVALRDEEASPVGDVLVTDGPVTGMVWSEDGDHLAWTDTTGLHTEVVEGDGNAAGAGELLSQDGRPVLDWVWELDDGAVAAGHLAVRVQGADGVELLGIERSSDGSLTVTGPAGGADRVILDTHAAPGTLDGSQVVASLGGGTALLTWQAEDDRSGELPDPGQLGGDVRVEVSGGHVLVMGDNRQVLVTFDGDVVDLPTAADWDVLD